MKKVFLLTDKGEDFCFYTKLVNKPVIEYPVMASYQAGVDQVYLLTDLIGIDDEKIKKIEEKDLNKHINKGDLLIFLSANMPLVKSKNIKKLFEKLEDFDMVVEEADSNAGIYALKADAYFKIYGENTDSKKDRKSDDSDSYMTNADDYKKDLEVRDRIIQLKTSLKNTDITNLKTNKQLFLVTNYEDLSKADIRLRKMINKDYMRKNVFIENPETVTIEKGVEIGEHTRIESGVRILGKSKIGKNCLIGFNSRIEDSIIHDNVEVFTSFIEKSEVEDYTNIGPYARLRPNAHLKKHVYIGNFVEVKNSTVGDGTKAGHLAYIGDAQLGKDINVGCGVIFANYDGKFKHKAIVEDGAFLGSNVNLVAPVRVEKDGFIAAGTTVTTDVKEGYLVVERADRKDIEGYVSRKRKKDLLKEQELKEKNAKK